MAKETISQTEGLCKEVANCIRNAYDRGYKQGFADGQKEKPQVIYEMKKAEYECGLNDAWELVRKLRHPSYEDTYSDDEKRDIFGYASSDSILTNLSASEAFKKVEEYEEKKKTDSEVKVGDEVYIIMKNYPSVVTCVFSESGFDNPKAVHITGSGRYAVTPCSQLHKTGRHFDSIAEVLEQLKGE